MQKIKGMNKLLVVIILTTIVLTSGSGCSQKKKLTLVRNGKTSYSIVVDRQAPVSVRNAANDLRSYFMKVSGASPEIVTDNQLPEIPFISVGNTSASKSEGLDVSAIPDDGFRIVTRGKNIFILGPDTPDKQVNSLGGVCNGTSNGVYAFIEDYLGVQWLMPGELGEEYTKVKTVSIPETDRTEYSPFNYRVVAFRSPGLMEDEWDRHMKVGRVADVKHNHSWIETIPPSWYDKHPDWFATSGGKSVPPSGSYYKLETTNPSLVQAFADVIIETFRNNPGQRWYSLSPSDGGGFSDRPAAQALTEKDPEGNISYTPLVLKFYNDVAGIVGKEFPEHNLGGYIYGQYRYPPQAGLPKLESNLSLMLVGYTHHYRLYRPGMTELNKNLMKMWGESAKKDGFNIYFYDYPVSLMAPNAIICPPTPDKLGFIFSHLGRNGFKGAYIYGYPVWPVGGAGNYIIAKLFWNPDLDATELMDFYLTKAFGREAAPFIGNIYSLLDTAFNHFYNQNLRAGSAVTSGHLKEIYAHNYTDLEKNYLKAVECRKNPRQKERLELFGQILSLMQWNLREYGFLPSGYESPLTRNAEEIDSLMSVPRNYFQITRRGNIGLESPLRVEESKSLSDGAGTKPQEVPVNRNIRMLLYFSATGNASVVVKDFAGNNEFVRYTFTNSSGEQLLAGVVARGRKLELRGEKGKYYFLDIPSRGASAKLEVSGAAIAYKSWPTGFQIAGNLMEGSLPLFFYVPDSIKSFNITLGTNGAIADIYSPDGKLSGRLSNVSRKVIRTDGSKAGFWKLVVPKTGYNVTLVLDEKLPQWFIPDPANPLKVMQSE